MYVKMCNSLVSSIRKNDYRSFRKCIFDSKIVLPHELYLVIDEFFLADKTAPKVPKFEDMNKEQLCKVTEVIKQRLNKLESKGTVVVEPLPTPIEKKSGSENVPSEYVLESIGETSPAAYNSRVKEPVSQKTNTDDVMKEAITRIFESDYLTV